MIDAPDFAFNVGKKIWVEKKLRTSKKLCPNTFVYTAIVKARLIDADTGMRFYYLTPYRTQQGLVGFNDQLLPALACEQTHQLVEE